MASLLFTSMLKRALDKVILHVSIHLFVIEMYAFPDVWIRCLALYFHLKCMDSSSWSKVCWKSTIAYRSRELIGTQCLLWLRLLWSFQRLLASQLVEQNKWPKKSKRLSCSKITSQTFCTALNTSYHSSNLF